MWVFLILEPARLLGACKPGSRARMDSRTGATLARLLGSDSFHLLGSEPHLLGSDSCLLPLVAWVPSCPQRPTS